MSGVGRKNTWTVCTKQTLLSDETHTVDPAVVLFSAARLLDVYSSSTSRLYDIGAILCSISNQCHVVVLRVAPEFSTCCVQQCSVGVSVCGVIQVQSRTTTQSLNSDVNSLSIPSTHSELSAYDSLLLQESPALHACHHNSSSSLALCLLERGVLGDWLSVRTRRDVRLQRVSPFSLSSSTFPFAPHVAAVRGSLVFLVRATSRMSVSSLSALSVCRPLHLPTLHPLSAVSASPVGLRCVAPSSFFLFCSCCLSESARGVRSCSRLAPLTPPFHLFRPRRLPLSRLLSPLLRLCRLLAHSPI